jgi:hypothetical protein
MRARTPGHVRSVQFSGATDGIRLAYGRFGASDRHLADPATAYSAAAQARSVVATTGGPEVWVRARVYRDRPGAASLSSGLSDPPDINLDVRPGVLPGQQATVRWMHPATPPGSD